MYVFLLNSTHGGVYDSLCSRALGASSLGSDSPSRTLWFLISHHTVHKYSALPRFSASAEAVGFEPTKPFRAHAFQACAIDHYATLPYAYYVKLLASQPLTNLEHCIKASSSTQLAAQHATQPKTFRRSASFDYKTGLVFSNS